MTKKESLAYAPSRNNRNGVGHLLEGRHFAHAIVADATTEMIVHVHGPRQGSATMTGVTLGNDGSSQPRHRDDRLFQDRCPYVEPVMDPKRKQADGMEQTGHVSSIETIHYPIV